MFSWRRKCLNVSNGPFRLFGNKEMSNIVTFSGGSVDLDKQPLPSVPEGMTEERLRALLQGSELGRRILFSGTSEGAKLGWLGRTRDTLRTAYQATKGAIKGAIKVAGGSTLAGALVGAPTAIGAVPGAIAGGAIGAIAGGYAGRKRGLEEVAKRKASEAEASKQVNYWTKELNKAKATGNAARIKEVEPVLKAHTNQLKWSQRFFSEDDMSDSDAIRCASMFGDGVLHQ